MLAGAAPVSWTGMATSVGLPNPGMSLWVFAALSAISGASIPPDLARAVAVCNILAILGLIGIARLLIPPERREQWYWGAALWAVNPIAIIFERKIWPPSVLPLLVVIMIAAWLCRSRRLGSFCWGLVIALTSQVHLAMAFFNLAVVGWTLRDGYRTVKWHYWLIGGAVAGWPALFWLAEILSGQHEAVHRLRSVVLLHFYPRWLTQPFGFGPEYSLGTHHATALLRWPLVSSHPTYLVLGAGVLICCIMAWLAVCTVQKIRQGRLDRSAVLGAGDTGTLIGAAFWGYGFLLTLLTVFGLDSHRHYLAPISPIMALWVASLTSWATRKVSETRVLLALLCLCQALVSANMLAYIHDLQIVPAEYGPTWRIQQTHPELAPRAMQQHPHDSR
jgi:hypothetical protein